MYAQENWKQEKNSAYLYRVLSDLESGTPRQLLFLELARESDEQAALWVNEIRKSGSTMPVAYVPSKRVKVVAWLIRSLGPRRIKPILAAMKIRGLSVYSGLRPASHAMPTSVQEVGASHRGKGNAGGLRAAVFGVNDGLVSIALLVVGVAGATAQNTTILLTGVAGLLAGAFSMATGEWISMRSQRKMFEYQIGLKRGEVTQYPAKETQELALIYQARSMTRDEALTLAKKRMIDDTESGLDALAHEELGLNPVELGSPWQAAAFSFFAFIFGGMIPLLPYLLGIQRHPLLIAVCLSCITLFGVGATLPQFTGQQALWGGFRMVALGGLAGAVTYFIGDLLGSRIS